MSFRAFAQSVSQDVRFAIRSFRETPVFATAAVVTLALGIAANTAIFSVINSVVLDSQPFRYLREPDRLTMVWERAPRMGKFFADRMPVRIKDYREWKSANHSFADLGIWRDLTLNLTDAHSSGQRHAPERAQAAEASANLFPLLGVRLQRGRYFRAAENTAGNDRVAILSDSLYRGRYGSDPAIVGKQIRANGANFTVVGVLPAGFALPAMWGGFDRKTIEFWVPMDLTGRSGSVEQMNCFVYGRLKDGATLAGARADVEAVQKRLAQKDEQLTFFSGMNVTSVHSEDAGDDLRRSMFVLQAAVGFVFLIACSNVANLLLTRAIRREKEMAVRTALGASRLRILRQLLTESFLLSSVAGAAGLFLGYWACQLVSYLAPKDTHGLHEIELNTTVLAFSIGVSFLSALLFGLAPYLHVRKQDINISLSRGSRSYSSSSGAVRNGLSIFEVALSVVLLIGAGLMMRTLWTLVSTDLGFQRDHLLSVHVTLPDDPYNSRARTEAFNRELLASARSVPGVKSVLMTTAIPMQSFTKGTYRIEGNAHVEVLPVSAWARVEGSYFETLKTRLIAGRTFQPGDPGSGTSVAVVNHSFAAQNGGSQSILGKAIVFDGEDGKEAKYRIAGVVADEHQLGPNVPSDPEFFVPGHALQSFYLIARTANDPLALAGPLQSAVWKLDGSLPVGEVRSMDGVLREWIAPSRFLMSLLIAFAGLALALAAIGLYSVLAYGVTLRTREIGIRVALGAEPGRVARSVVFDGCKLAVAGIVVGILAAGFLAQFMQSLIYGVNAVDPWTFTAVPIVLAAITLAASYLPARRAARVDPTVALRAE